MTREQYARQMQRMTDCFGDKTLNSERVNYIWSHVKDLHDNDLARIVSRFIETMRTCPMPTHFIEESKKARYRQKKWVGEQATIEEHSINCAHCFDTGLCFIKPKDPNLSRVVLYCHCEKGNEEFKQDPESMPQMTLNYRKSILKYPLSLFVPKSEKQMGEIIGKLSKLKADSKAYWKTRKTK